MPATTVTLGEIMLRLTPPGFERLMQSPMLHATFGGGEANVAASLAGFGLPAAFVTILPQANPLADAAIGELRGFGVRISLDDFGTGYSSLSYLRSFPFDKIKIDRSFVSELATRDDSMAIVRAVTGLGKSLGIVTTAEGVETEAQFDLLRREGCTQAQGYLFSKPRPAAEVGAMLSRPRARIVAAHTRAPAAARACVWG